MPAILTMIAIQNLFETLPSLRGFKQCRLGGENSFNTVDFSLRNRPLFGSDYKT